MSAFMESIYEKLVDAGVAIEPDPNTPFDDDMSYIFIEKMPHAVKNGVLLVCRPEGPRVDYSITGYLRTRGRLIVRGVSYKDTMAKALEVQRAMHLQGSPQDLSGVLFHELYCETAAGAISPVTEGGLIEAGMTWRAAWVDEFGPYP